MTTKVRETGRLAWRDHQFVTDLAQAPTFCPLCGRLLEHRAWPFRHGTREYRYRCCFGGSRLAWWARLVSVTTPRSAHYIWEDNTPYPTEASALAADAPAFNRTSGLPR